MGKKDNAQKAYFDDKERFADMFNGALFGGKEVIKSNELQEADPNIVYQENPKHNIVIADKLHRWKGMHLALLVFESQSYVDYGMVFRAMKEEALCYDKQIRKRTLDNKTKKILKDDEFICGIKKGQLFIPVVVLVVYLGTHKPWDGAVCLHDMLRMDKRLQPYITNYKLNLFDYHEYKDFSYFRTVNRELFEILSCTNDEEKMNKIITQNRERYSAIDIDAAECINKIAKIKLPIIKEVNGKGKEMANMCKAWDDHREAGRREGLLEGERKGKLELLVSLVRENLLSLTEAAKRADMSEVEFSKLYS